MEKKIDPPRPARSDSDVPGPVRLHGIQGGVVSLGLRQNARGLPGGGVVMKLLDLFCGAGGAAMGYYRAGFKDITGIDNQPMPRYPFNFIQADALEYLEERGHEYDVIHASPPCQRYSIITPIAHKGKHPDLIEPIRTLLIKTGKPYVIENVPGARHLLINPIKLCGTMFRLNLWRHRFFEVNPWKSQLIMCCNHSSLPVLITGTCRKPQGRFENTAQECREASGLYWMTRKEMDEAIPPAYTEWLGKRILEALNA